MTFVTVMGTVKQREILQLSEYRINSNAVDAICSHATVPVVLSTAPDDKFMSPICLVLIGSMTLFVSGTADELEARFRT